MSEEITEGLGRRDVLKRGALLGGAVIWTTPVVQSLASPAFANGSPPGAACTYSFQYVSGANTACYTYQAPTQAECDAFVAFYCGPGMKDAVISALWVAAFQNIGYITFNCSGPQNPPACI